MLYSNWKLEKAKRNSNKFVKISRSQKPQGFHKNKFVKISVIM